MGALNQKLDKEFWVGKKVLVTGHTGFKGSWLTYWLKKCGAEVCGISLDPVTSPSLWNELKIDLNGFDIGMADMTYGWTKLTGEFLAKLAHEKYQLDI